MYKKIYHTILEEHFAHPAVLPKAVLKNGRGELPPEVMTEKTMLYRMDSRTLWAKYVWGLLNYGIALNNNVPSIEFIKARAVKNAGNLGDFIVPYYGIENGAKFAQLLGDFVKIGTDVVQIVKDGGDVDGGEAIWGTTVAEIAKFLNWLNPDNWPEAAVADYFTKIARFWVDEIKTRAKEEWVANDVTIEGLSHLVITSQGAHNGSAGSLADVFSRGIIAQFPDKFVG